MAQWAVVIPARAAATPSGSTTTRRSTLSDGGDGPARSPATRSLVVADAAAPRLFALGRVAAAAGRADDDPDDAGVADGRPVVVTYTHRLFDEPADAAG